MSEPLVSIFLPTHCRFANGLLQKSVESVLGQNYQNFEFFIVDDASVDGTAAYLSKVAQADNRVTHIRHDKNVGLLALTLAQAYMRSRGDFIAFAFDDTEWYPNHLQTLIDYLELNAEAAMVYGGVNVSPPGTTPLLLGHREFDWSRLDEDNFIGHSGVVLRRATVEKIGWLDPNILVKRTCDWDLWLRIGKKMKVGYCPEIVAVEKGVVQADSLGLSVSRFDALTRKYQQTERDHILTPSAVAAGKTPRFDALEWMSDEERHQLRLLSFEHLIRTREIPEATGIAASWLQERSNIDVSAKSDIEILAEAFNLYLAETRYACKNTCSSAFKLNDLTDAHNTLNIHHNTLKKMYDELLQGYRGLEEQHNALLGSLSWRLTTPLRKLNKILARN